MDKLGKSDALDIYGFVFSMEVSENWYRRGTRPVKATPTRHRTL